MRKIRDVLRLRLADQLSLRQVSLSLAIPHTTVADYVRRARNAGITSWPLPEELTEDDALEARLFASPASAPRVRPEPDFAMMKHELAKKAMTLMLLWVEYKELHPDGYEYSQFCQLYRTWRKKLDVTMRQDHKAGEKMFVDFPGLTIPIYDERDLTVSFQAELFVAVLGASSYLYAEALRSQELVHWISGHENAFWSFGGCPAICVPDNLRSGVTKPHRYEADVNATYQEMAEHYGVVIIPARPYKPRDKAKVEVGVQVAERWIIMRLRKERFTSLGALNERIGELVEVINQRPFKKLEGSRALLFAEIDQPALHPLPTARYDFATWKKAKVSLDYHLAIERNFYSVPYHLVGSVLDVRERRRGRGLLQEPSRGQPQTQLLQGSSGHRAGPHAEQPPSPRCLDAQSHRALGEKDRTLNGWVHRGVARESTPPRTGVPLRARCAATREALRPRTPRGRLRTLARDPLLLLQVRLLDPATRARSTTADVAATTRESDSFEYPRCELLPMKEGTC